MTAKRKRNLLPVPNGRGRRRKEVKKKRFPFIFSSSFFDGVESLLFPGHGSCARAHLRLRQILAGVDIYIQLHPPIVPSVRPSVPPPTQRETHYTSSPNSLTDNIPVPSPGQCWWILVRLLPQVVPCADVYIRNK